jgi:uncharacterized membrane protein
MPNCGHLWAIGFDDIERAARVRDEIARLAERKYLILVDTAVAVRFLDGSVTLNGEPFVNATNIRLHSFAGFLAGLALGAPPLTGAAVGPCSEPRAPPRARSASTRTSSAKWSG